MSFLTREQRYELLKSVKRQGGVLSVEEEDFIMDFAWEKLQEVLSDPEVMTVFKRMKDR